MQVFIGIGSNLGNRRKTIELAISHLKSEENIRVRKVSRLYETEAVGGPPQGKFLNAAIEIEVKNGLSAKTLLNKLKDIELKLGRSESKEKWMPRRIDLDILLYGDLVLEEENLKIPHPLMNERLFVLEPLSEIAPGAYHPLRKQTIAELKKITGQTGKITGTARRAPTTKYDKYL